jgi:hypothetical protein
MPKYKFVDDVTGESSVVDWTKDTPPTEEDIHSHLKKQISDRIDFKKKQESKRQSMSFPQRVLEAAAEETPYSNVVHDPSLSTVAGAVIRAFSDEQDSLKSSASQLGQGFVRMMGLGDAPQQMERAQQQIQSGVSPFKAVGNVIGGNIADVVEGGFGVATPTMIVAGAGAPVQAAKAIIPFMAADYGVRKLEPHVGIDPESGMGRLIPLVAGAGASARARAMNMFRARARASAPSKGTR